MTETVPPAPERSDPKQFPEEMRLLYEGVQASLAALPAYFDFDNQIGGVDATDLHALNTLMGAAIEVQVVNTLNGMRQVWDADHHWVEYAFVRYAQAFPDVRLVKRTEQGPVPVFGVELKGWFLLAKEGVPSLRFRAAAGACNPWDLVCVVPWYLNNAVAGTPQVARPWVEQARYAAEWRDHWWQYIRRSKSSEHLRGVSLPADPHPYPSKADLVGVAALEDRGDNFGRLPRARPLMDAFVKEALELPILGIPALHWQRFLKAHTDHADGDDVIREMLSALPLLQDAPEQAERLRALLRELTTGFDFS